VPKNTISSNTVRSYSSGVANRSLNQARTHHFIIDGSSDTGAPEALAAPEVFLSGVSACAVNLMCRTSKSLEIPLTHSQVTIEGLRDSFDLKEVPAHFEQIKMVFEVWGPNSDQANELVKTYQHN
jgi:hypothetical protein